MRDISSVLRYCKTGAFLRDTGALKMHMCEIHRAAHAFGCIIPNEADIEITNCRLADIESEWHRATRPSKLFQEANYNEQGDVTLQQTATNCNVVWSAEDLTIAICCSLLQCDVTLFIVVHCRVATIRKLIFFHKHPIIKFMHEVTVLCIYLSICMHTLHLHSRTHAHTHTHTLTHTHTHTHTLSLSLSHTHTHTHTHTHNACRQQVLT